MKQKKIGTKGVNLHIETDPCTSRSWCAKFSIISLMALFFGLIGLIIEDHFLSDLSTPVQKSLYFDGHEEENHDLHFEAFKEIKEYEIHGSEYLEETHDKKPVHSAIYENENNKDIKISENNEEYCDNLESLLQKIVHQASENNAIDSEEKSSVTHHNFEFIEDELSRAEEKIKHNNIKAALNIYESLALTNTVSAAAIYGKINALKHIATISRSDNILRISVKVCLQYLEEYDGNFSDEDFKTLSYICIDHMKSIEYYYLAIRIHIILIDRFDDDPMSSTELAYTYLDMNRISDAKDTLLENIKRWPNNGQALVHYGLLLLKTNYEDAIHYLRLGIETNDEGTQDHYPYTMLSNALLHYNRTDEARKLIRKGVAKKIFKSEFQRPIEFIQDLKPQPIWMKEETSYIDIFNLLESNWRQIRDEGIKVLNEDGYFDKDRERHEPEIADRESLIDFGIWQEFLLFTDGYEMKKNCKRVQFTCSQIRALISAGLICDMGSVLFTAIHPGTHVKPHCGRHNLRLRAHLGLKIPNGTKIRVARYERSWEEGKFFIFDDSFEHEIWNNGTGIRLVLLIDFWHPEITDDYKKLHKK